jgi:hypothetical protein
MYLRYFNEEQVEVLSEALDIAEDMTSNYYQLSQSQWKRYPYDVKTLSQLFGEDIKDNAFAILKKYAKSEHREGEPLFKTYEFYLICLQDNQILKALQRDKELKLLPLLAYVLTHELVHIVRFCKFQERFDVKEIHKRSEEEHIVHQTTCEILKELSLPNLSYIVDSYMPDRVNMEICVG